MMLSRMKAAVAANTMTREKTGPVPSLEEFVAKRDYLGAVALLEFDLSNIQSEIPRAKEWLGYCAFHLGDYKKAMKVYQELTKEPNCDPIHFTNLACCYFFLGQYNDAEREANAGPAGQLQVRLLFHISHKHNDENKLMTYHQKLKEGVEDQLSLASIHYLRSHFQEATDIYKRLLLENRDFHALNVYVSMCYYKLDYYDVSIEILQMYMQHFPDSPTAINLKACNHFKLYNGKAAEVELKPLIENAPNIMAVEHDLVRMNLVVFRNGENALQVLPPLVDVIPEARLNLVIYHLRQNEVEEAHRLVKDTEPTTPQEYILKGVVNAVIGQKKDNRDNVKSAQQYFQLVGASASECDTIPGRQCMASCFFLLKQFEDVQIYLKSIKTYMYNDDKFNWNYGLCKASLGQYKEAEEALQLVQDEKMKEEYVYLSWLARCYIMNSKARLAWELYLKMETSNESFQLLQLIANDCYKMGLFFYSAKAFDVLERLDPNPEYWEGKRGSCVGVFQQIVANKEPPESLRDVLSMLRNTSNPQVEYIVRLMKKWAKEKGIRNMP